MIKNSPPKGVSFSDLICNFVMSIVGFSFLFLQHQDNLKTATCNLFDIYGCGCLSKTTRFRKESLCCSRKRQNPLTPWCDLRQYAKGHEDLRLPKIKFESHHVCIIACVYIQNVLSCSPNPFCRDRNTLEYKSFDSACAFKSKALHVCVRYEVSVKVSYQSGQKQEHRVFPPWTILATASSQSRSVFHPRKAKISSYNDTLLFAWI